MLFADVILPVPLAQLFTYNVPDEMREQIAIGSRVVVQFGKKKSYSAIVYRLHSTAPEKYETKSILSVVDPEPIVVDRQLKLWEWIAEYYICSLGEVYKASLPSGLKLESETKLVVNPLFEPEDEMSVKQQTILNYVRNKKICPISDLVNHCAEDFNPLPQIKRLLDMGALYISEEMRDGYKPKTEIFYSLSTQVRSEAAMSECMDKLERAPKQLETLMALIQVLGGYGKARKGGAISRHEVSEAKGVSMTAMAELVKKGVVDAVKESVSRLGVSDIEVREPLPLSEAQQEAYNSIKQAFENKSVTLLQGVTSSGKTEIYIHLIKECIEQGKQVLYMLPEIALTTQITTRLYKYFGSSLGIYHSKFNDSERVEVWNKLLSTDDYKVILGVRSSVLLPFRNIGLIIVDEEHESSYKQYDPAPRYNARDMAIVLAGIHGAKVLLGSATPSLETYQNATEGKYGYVQLLQRYAGIAMPEILPIDMLDARKKRKMVSLFSFELKEAIDNALKNREQVILFQNRRGFSPYVECGQCAWVAKCQNCDVSLTYHKHTNSLVCHYCSYTVNMPYQCPACGTPHLEPHGYGTEQIEEQVKEVFPSARVVRMDLDTARSKKAYENIIEDFENYKYDILVGTQMISKGLDFERVSVVGIINADSMYNMPDFRANERCFQLISQVSGRAGRHGSRGKVYIQTRDIQNPVVINVMNNDFNRNSQEQLRERSVFHYPPFFRMLNITIKHRDVRMAQMAALELSQSLRQLFGARVLGPQEPVINRISNMYLQRIILKMEKQSSPQQMKHLMMDTINRLIGSNRYKGVVVQIDVDPY